MKPNFALTLSFEGIGLLHRAFPGWHLVGEIDLDNPDLLGDLRALRDKAVALDPSGVRSKLVIPNDQIKYISFAAGSASVDDIPDLVDQNLAGETPYALDELAYDWVFDDGRVQVAAVARETLREAEAFAHDHRFNPICFVASPVHGDFTGEPFFGETSMAPEFKVDGEAVERDPVPVRIIGTAKIPEVNPPKPEETDAASATQPDEQVAKDDPDTPVTEDAGFAEPSAVFEHQDTADEIDDADPAPTPDAPAAFTSIRAQRGDAPTVAPKLEGVARHFTPVPVSAEVVSDRLPIEVDEADDTAQDTREPEIASPRVAPAVIPPAPPELSPAASSGHSGFATRRSAPLTATPVAARSSLRTPPFEEEQRMTIFGAREADPIGGKPKYLALVLTVVLLLFLAGVAAWASIFLDDGLAGFFRDEPDTAVAEVPAVPDIADETAAQDDATEAEPASLPNDEDTSVENALREALEPQEALELSEDEVRARYAATGIWLTAPDAPHLPTVDSLETFYQTSIDRAVPVQDAVALPGINSLLPDQRPETPGSPARAGTKFVLDDRGLVLATPQGALSPDGIIVYAGQPPIRPAAMPKRVVVAEQDLPTITADPRLAAFRPRTRPTDLEQTTERDTLGGRTRDELATLRPRLRPQSAQEAAELAARSTRTDDETDVQPFIDLDAVNSAVTEAVESDTVFETAMPQAVASSLKPNTRPRNFDRIVNRSAPSQEAAVAVSASQRVAPRIPTATSVAKQATQRNVLKLRKVNLIGVYGAPNSRRALVRLSNGRYRKVKIGDRLDGGKVSAIGDSELRYQKSGRSLVLKMPKG